jgi:hypothetical protein
MAARLGFSAVVSAFVMTILSHRLSLDFTVAWPEDAFKRGFAGEQVIKG